MTPRRILAPTTALPLLLALALPLALPISTLTPLRGIVGLLTIPSPAIGLAAHVALLGLRLIELVAIATRSRVENQFVVLYVGAQLQHTHSISQ